MGDCTDPVGPVPAHFLVVRCTAIAALLVLLQSANIVQAARLHRRGHDGPAAGPVADAVADLTELSRNIIRGLKLDRLPDMDKVTVPEPTLTPHPPPTTFLQRVGRVQGGTVITAIR